MFKTKAIKILSIVFILSFLFCITVSAEVTDNINDPLMNGFNVSNIEISIKDGSGNNLVKSISASKVADLHYRYVITCTQSLVKGKNYDVYANIIPNEQYITTEYSVLGEFTWLVLRNGNFSIVDYNKSYNYRNFSSVDLSYKQYPDRFKYGVTPDDYPYFTTYYDTQEKNTKYEFYRSHFVVQVNNENTSTIYLYLNSLKFRLVDPETVEITTNQDENTDKIIDNQDKNAQDIQDNQDKNTDKLIQAQKDQVESERQEATETGDDGADEILGEIPSNTNGVVSAFSKLTSSMIHNDTSCILSFPGIKIPPLKPFTTNETVLLEEDAIDMKTAIDLIPDTYLKLIRALCDIAIIVYCFKEMYGQLAFLFTAKGGGDNE